MRRLVTSYLQSGSREKCMRRLCPISSLHSVLDPSQKRSAAHNQNQSSRSYSSLKRPHGRGQRCISWALLNLVKLTTISTLTAGVTKSVKRQWSIPHKTDGELEAGLYGGHIPTRLVLLPGLPLPSTPPTPSLPKSSQIAHSLDLVEFSSPHL